MKDVKALKLMTLNDVLSQINGDMTLELVQEVQWNYSYLKWRN